MQHFGTVLKYYLSRRVAFAQPHLLCAVYFCQLCDAWKDGVKCKYGKDCLYAHGLADLRKPEQSTTYKTLMCKDELLPGGCKYGDTCYYLHTSEITNLSLIHI